MTATTSGITFVDVDVTGLMHTLQVEPQLLAFHADRSLNAHQATGVILSFSHPREVKQNSVERHR
jgi:hypothetical protein